MPYESVEDLPTWSGMEVGRADWPAGTDYGPLLKGLPDDLCQCPHWGYVISGSLEARYADGTEEHIEAGNAFYMPPGHTGRTEEGVTFIVVSPEKEAKATQAHVKEKREAAQ
jgi:hypothetical protein